MGDDKAATPGVLLATVVSLGSAVAGLVALALGIGVVATSTARDVLGVPETTIARTSYIKAGFLIVPESIKSVVAYPWLDVWKNPTLMAAVVAAVLSAVLPRMRKQRDRVARVVSFVTLIIAVVNGHNLLAVFDHTARNLLQPSTAPSAALGAEMATLLLRLLRGESDARAVLDNRYASFISVIGLLIASGLLLLREHSDWLDLRRIFGSARTAGHKTTHPTAFSWPATSMALTFVFVGTELIGVPFAYGVMKLVQPPICTQLTLTSSMATYYNKIRTTVIGDNDAAQNMPTGALLSDLSADPDEIHLLTRTEVNQLYLHKFKRQDVIGFLFTGSNDCRAF